MTTHSRRDFLENGVTLAGAAAAVTATPAMALGSSGAPPYETLTSAVSPWIPVRVLDTDRMPWSREQFWDARVLFSSPDMNSHLSIIRFLPQHSGRAIHYHTSHEWAFGLSGDLVNCEYASPDQRVGALVRYTEGYFLDRPPYSLHGFESGRHLESQMGATLLLMGEGGRSVSPIPGHPVYSEEYKQVKEWGRPRIIDTIEKMPWEPDPLVKDSQAKHLADDPSRGFRAVLRYLPPGWNSSQSPGFARAYYYRQACQFNFVLAGDLRIQAYRAPGQKAERLTLSKHFYAERAPMSIFGLGDGVVTEHSCVWLEATYAKGATISNSPIEEPNHV